MPQPQLQPAPFRVPFLTKQGEVSEEWKRWFLSDQVLVNFLLAQLTSNAPHPGILSDDSIDSDPIILPGPLGPIGPQGVQGVPGLDGESGEDGLTIPGVAGPAGATGAAGVAGTMGPPGLDGDVGEDGFSVPGVAGIAGAVGAIGPTGLDGLDGDDGLSVPGVPGISGAVGAIGPPGLDGVDADDGLLFPPGFTGILRVPFGGTGVSGYTAGSVVFSDGTKLTEDNANLFWDNTNKRLGLGTATPSFKLDSTGDIRMGNLSYLYANDSGGTPRALITLDASNILQIRNASAGGTIRIGLDTTPNIILAESGGLVGIGAGTPAKLLDVNGTFRSQGNSFFTGLSTSNLAQSASMCLSASNEAISDTFAGCVVSARKFKDNIFAIVSGLEIVTKLTPVSFTYKQSDNHLFSAEQIRVGFIADDALLVDARLVGLNAEGEPHAFDYQGYTAILTKAIQELVEIVQLLDRRLNTLKHGD